MCKVLEEGLACHNSQEASTTYSYTSPSPTLTGLHIFIPDSKSLPMLSLLPGMPFLVSSNLHMLQHPIQALLSPQGLLCTTMTFPAYSTHSDLVRCCYGTQSSFIPLCLLLQGKKLFPSLFCAFQCPTQCHTVHIQ